mmetsp:Transcript_6572/g.9578  ORF Transcript_6572/g.9578 Transcript_6572/m.9578 type:complete len:194 (+) Transcript_6572:2-583(+)
MISPGYENNMHNTNHQRRGLLTAKTIKCFMTMSLICMENVKAFVAQQKKQIPTKLVCNFKTQTSPVAAASYWMKKCTFMKEMPSDFNRAEKSSLSMTTNRNQFTDRPVAATVAGQFLFIRKTNKPLLTKKITSSSIIIKPTTTITTALSMASYIGDFESVSSNTFVNPAPLGAFKSWYNVMDPLAKTPAYANE